MGIGVEPLRSGVAADELGPELGPALAVFIAGLPNEGEADVGAIELGAIGRCWVAVCTACFCAAIARLKFLPSSVPNHSLRYPSAPPGGREAAC